MSGQLLLSRDVAVAFHCPYARGALVIDGAKGKPLCTNARTWFARGKVESPEEVHVHEGGHCPDCGYMATAQLRDRDGLTGARVVVHG